MTVALKRRDRRAGGIISSIDGLRSYPTVGAYGISPAANMELVRNLAPELGPWCL